MKKKILAALLSVLTIFAAAGCQKDETTHIEDSEKSAVSDEVKDNSSDEKEKDNNKDSENKVNKDKNKTEKNEKEDSENSGENVSDDKGGNDKDNENSDTITLENAEKIYQNAADIYFNLRCYTPYELDYSDEKEVGYYRITDSGIDSVQDIFDYYETVFKSADELEKSEKYVEYDGVPYCRDSARGANIYYQSTDLVFVEGDDEKAVFDAVSHYADPETGEEQPDETERFTLVNTENGWRVDEFTSPK